MDPEVNELLLEKKNGILTITLNRPARLNAYTDKMLSDLLSVFTEAAIDKHTRTVILTGSGRAFCSGHDLFEERPQERIAKYRVAQVIHELGKPIIAAINGIAVGGALV